MRIALTGASGFIGVSTARLLAQSGHEVIALVRSSSSTEPLEAIEGVEVRRWSQADRASWPDAFRNAEAIIHNSVDWTALRSGDLAAHLDSNLAASIELIHFAHDRGAHRFSFVSSVAVHHDMSPAWKGVIDEEHPLRPHGLYGACKAAVEPHLWDAHYRRSMHTTAIRPAAVYGVEPVNLVRSHGFREAAALIKGETITPEISPGGGKWVHVDDVALALARSIERDGAAGRAFNLADCYAKRTRFAEHARDALGLPEDRVVPDTTPPAKNVFDKTATQEVLGVPLDRGDDGLREHMAALVEAIKAHAA